MGLAPLWGGARSEAARTLKVAKKYWEQLWSKRRARQVGNALKRLKAEGWRSTCNSSRAALLDTFWLGGLMKASEN